MDSKINNGFRVTAGGYEPAQVDGFIFDLLLRLHEAEGRIAELEGQLPAVLVQKAA